MTWNLHVAAPQIHAGRGIDDTFHRLKRQVAAAAAVGVDVLGVRAARGPGGPALDN